MDAAFFQLSDTEHEVLLLVTEGLTNDQIARRLNKSPATVKHQVAAAHRKSGISSRVALAVWFVRSQNGKAQ
ncbi:MAG: hypothetical protein NVS3B24_03970 [Candidatus Dormibacteria bacterium]